MAMSATVRLPASVWKTKPDGSQLGLILRLLGDNGRRLTTGVRVPLCVAQTYCSWKRGKVKSIATIPRTRMSYGVESSMPAEPVGTAADNALNGDETPVSFQTSLEFA